MASEGAGAKRVRAYLCLGSNLGDREAAMAAALERIEQAGVEIVGCSSLYETPPWGPVPQGPYLNLVVAVETLLPARALLEALLRIEREGGRDRSGEVRFGPRVIDLDILLFGAEVVAEPDLELPHPRMMERAFVLVPLNELAPDLVVEGQSVRDALGRLDASGIRKIGSLSREPGGREAG